jgi:VIT1/CCC1 family predicted Fe2+/Mn2+ transporter
VGALGPLALAVAVPAAEMPVVVSAASLVLLAIMGAVAARLGGAAMTIGAVRVAFWGAMAMGCTALVGRLFGARL